MGLLDKLSRSSALVAGMADRLGVDLAGDTPLQAEQAARDIREMVMRCSTCTGQDDCQALQAQTTHLDAPPRYCVNADRLRA